MRLEEFLSTSYTCYHAAENAAAMLKEAGFCELGEAEIWSPVPGGRYFVRRGGSLVAFRYQRSANAVILAAHTDSPCFKLKGSVLADETCTRLNAEPYGGGLWYTFFDRPLRIAGRVANADGKAELFASDFCVVLPSLAIHQARDANEKFSPNLQTELPLLALGKRQLADLPFGTLSYDLFAVPDEAPFRAGASGELLCSPRIDDLVSAWCAVGALLSAKEAPFTQICALFEAEEIGSRTDAGAGGDLLSCVLERLAAVGGFGVQETLAGRRNSLLVSVDGAHAKHPNHAEKSDPADAPVLGGGVVLKSHAGGAYTTDAVSRARVTAVLAEAEVPVQNFYNRSDAKSGSTLGPILIARTGMPAADLGIAQLAMHSAVETAAVADVDFLERALTALLSKGI